MISLFKSFSVIFFSSKAQTENEREDMSGTCGTRFLKESMILELLASW